MLKNIQDIILDIRMERENMIQNINLRILFVFESQKMNAKLIKNKKMCTLYSTLYVRTFFSWTNSENSP